MRKLIEFMTSEHMFLFVLMSALTVWIGYAISVGAIAL